MNKVDYHVTVVSMVLNTIALNPVKRSVRERSYVVWSHQKKIPWKKIPKIEILIPAPENKKLKKRVWARMTFF